MKGYFYMASPYSKYPKGLEQAFVDAARECARLNRHGIITFSPIVHAHPLTVHGGLDWDQIDFESWRDFDEALMAGSQGLIVVQLEGWRGSQGVNAEIEWFWKNPKPGRRGTNGITFIRPGELPDWHIQTLPAEDADYS